MVRRLVLFRFHGQPALCRNRLQLLRLFNPGADLFGLFGGQERRFPAFERKLEGHLDGLYCLRGQTPQWKWRNSDLALQRWFQEQGHRVPFDVLHFIEWDLLLLAPLAELFGRVPAGSVGLAKLRPVRDLVGRWVWVSKEPYRSEWEQLLRHLRGAHGYAAEPFSCNCAGATLPRAFLERCAGERIPELVNDEARFTLYAQAFGFDLVDNGLVDPARPEEERYFNLRGREIRDRDIHAELGKKDGRRVFHPYRKIFARLVRAGLFPNLFSGVRRRLGALSKRRLNIPGPIGEP